MFNLKNKLALANIGLMIHFAAAVAIPGLPVVDLGYEMHAATFDVSDSPATGHDYHHACT